MKGHERTLFNAMRDMKPDNPHFKSKIDFTPTLAKWLARELSKSDNGMILVQQVYMRGFPFEIVGRMAPQVDTGLLAISELMKLANIPGISASDVDRFQPPLSMQTFEVIASIDFEWDVTIMSNHSGSALDGAVRRWCASLGLAVSK